MILSCNNRKNDKPSDAKTTNDTASSKVENISNLTTETIRDTINKSFQDFWVIFRNAVIENDTIKLVQLTKFPLETRGPQDSDPIVKYDSKNFIIVFQKYLKQDSGLGIDNETQLDLIKRLDIYNKNESKYNIPEENWVRVGNLKFTKNGN